MTSFNLSKFSGRKPIKDRGIKWVEAYQERSAPLKKRFDKDIGPGAYYRFEGHDFTTNSDYYVVIGPSVQHNVGKRFFSGIKKLPPEHDREKKVYSPYGEYFPTIRSALSYAIQKWAIQMPHNQPNYTVQDLNQVEIPEHIKA